MADLKIARWDNYDGDWYCSNCGAIVESDEEDRHNWYYCYHCGAKMENPYFTKVEKPVEKHKDIFECMWRDLFTNLNEPLSKHNKDRREVDKV